MRFVFAGSLAAALFCLAPLAWSQGQCEVAPALTDLGGGTSGSLGTPALGTTGVPVIGSPFAVELTRGAAMAPGLLMVAPDVGATFLPQYGGTVFPAGNPFFALPIVLDGLGRATFPLTIGPGLCGLEVVLQAGVFDAGATGGVALTNGLDIVFGTPRGPWFPSEVSFIAYLATDVATGDVNGDGHADVVLATREHFATDGLKVLTGRGDGTLEDAAAFQTGAQTSGIALGDVSNDGVLDAVLTRRLIGDVIVMLGVGDGTFAPPTAIAVGALPSAVAVADLDADGAPDLVVTNESSDTVSVLRGAGGGSFVVTQTLAVGDRPLDVSVDDVDGDGSLDIAVALGSNDGVAIALGLGNGSFAAANLFAAGAFAESIATASLDGDGTCDVVVSGGSTGGSVWLLPGNGDGTLAPAIAVSAGSSPRGCALRDIDGDGRLDLAVANDVAGEVFVRFGIATGPFGASAQLPSAPNPHCVALVDLDGDASVDVASVAINTVTVELNTGAGAFPTNEAFQTGTKPKSIQVAELTGDGILDLVLANDTQSSGSGVSILPGQGDGGFGAVQHVASNNQIPRDVEVGDMNSDGIVDLVVGNAVGSVRIRPGGGPGLFLLDTGFFATTDGVNAVDLADVDGDGDLDVLCTSGVGEVLFGAGDGTLGSPVSLGLGGGYAWDIVATDLDADGLVDVVASKPGADAISVVLGVGAGSFGAPVSLAVGDLPGALAVGDVDADGAPDVVVGHAGIDSNGDTVGVLLGAGGGTLAPCAYYGARVGEGLALADIDLDGRVDIVSTNHLGGHTSVLFGLGDGSFAGQRNHATALRPAAVAIADFDGDGFPDVAVANVDVDRVTILLNGLLD